MTSTEAVRKWRVANPERDAEHRAKYKEMCRERSAAERAHIECCECCGRPESGGPGSWARDHDHVTGEFRGRLCQNCNLGIGKLGDNLAGLYAAVRYLEDRA